MALTVVNNTNLDITATLTSSQSSPMSANGTWQPSSDPTSFTLRVTHPSDPTIDTWTSFGPAVVTATFQRVGQTYGFILEPPQ